MLEAINGLHHVTAMAKDAARNNRFWTRTLGLRRVKQTVNFDEPSVYHLYYGDAAGTPGTVMTYFPFPNIAPGRAGSGEVGTTALAVPPGALDFWSSRLGEAGIEDLRKVEQFGEKRLEFSGPDGERLALVEQADDSRLPWSGAAVDAAVAIRGFHSVVLDLRDDVATRELLQFMGYRLVGSDGTSTRLALPSGNGASVVDIALRPELARATLGAGSVHHVAFSVADRRAQLAVREAFIAAGHSPTPVIDRDYFHAIYFRTPGGVLFEIATDEPGFATDEAPDTLGSTLQLPQQHAHLRASLEASLPPLEEEPA